MAEEVAKNLDGVAINILKHLREANGYVDDLDLSRGYHLSLFKLRDMEKIGLVESKITSQGKKESVITDEGIITLELHEKLGEKLLLKPKIKKIPEYRCPKPDCGSTDVAAFVSYNRCRTCGYESRDFQEWERE